MSLENAQFKIVSEYYPHNCDTVKPSSKKWAAAARYVIITLNIPKIVSHKIHFYVLVLQETKTTGLHAMPQVHRQGRQNCGDSGQKLSVRQAFQGNAEAGLSGDKTTQKRRLLQH